jgi:sigma-54 dependent transcriptional regulator, acetoin dehydrogenase operon transcriptional activator AcoR
MAMRATLTWEKRDRAIADVWERFASGGDVQTPELRPEILLSWRRCRDEYKIDPWQSRAPPADDYCEHSLTNDRVVAELGSVGRSLLDDVQSFCGLVAITDGAGRILTVLGDRRALRRGENSNLAPWSAWSEQANGTNGMGTALEDPNGILVRRCEHWCAGLQDWSCAGTTIRDPATSEPLAVLDVSCWQDPLPDGIVPWLRHAVQGIESELHEQATRDACDLEEALGRMARRCPSQLIALDVGGRIVAVKDSAENGGSCGLDLATDCPPLGDFVREGVSRARADHGWVGFAEAFVSSAGEIIPVAIRPVVQRNRIIGMVGTLGESAGEQLAARAPVARPSGAPLRRVVAFEGNRLIFLHPEQIIFAEAEQNTVWLTTDRGRMRARGRGLERLATELRGCGFVRVHRHFVVNARRVSEIMYGFRGQLYLVMEQLGSQKTIPVSRRRRAAARTALLQ